MKNMYNKLNLFSWKPHFLCQIFQAAMKFLSSAIPEFNFQKVHSELITQIVPCPLLQHTYLSPHWCFSDFTWQLTNLVTSLVQIRGFCDDKTQFSTIPMWRKATKGSPQNVFSRFFYQHQMFSAWKKQISLTFKLLVLIPCKNTTMLFCKSFLPTSAAAASWKQGIIVKAMCAFSSSFTHKFHIPSFCLGINQMFSHGATASQYQIFHLYAAFTVRTSPLWSCQHPTTSHCLFCLHTRERQFQSHLTWVYYMKSHMKMNTRNTGWKSSD